MGLRPRPEVLAGSSPHQRVGAHSIHFCAHRHRLSPANSRRHTAEQQSLRQATSLGREPRGIPTWVWEEPGRLPRGGVIRRLPEPERWRGGGAGRCSGLLGVKVGVGEEPETPLGHQGKQVQGGQLPHFTCEPQEGLAGTHPGTPCGGREAEVGGVGGRGGLHTPSVFPAPTQPSASSASSCGPCRHSCPCGGRSQFGAPDKSPKPARALFPHQ